MPNTYTLLETITVGAATASSVTFNSIPQTGYTDLVLVCNGLVTANTETPAIQFNTDTGQNYSWTTINGNGTTAVGAQSNNPSQYVLIPASWTSGWSSSNNNTAIFNVQNYSNTTTYKTALARNTNPSGVTSATVGLWRNTATITSIVVLATNTTFQTGATFNLYGITAA